MTFFLSLNFLFYFNLAQDILFHPGLNPGFSALDKKIQKKCSPQKSKSHDTIFCTLNPTNRKIDQDTTKESTRFPQTEESIK
jgi:hypothetical protein